MKKLILPVAAIAVAMGACYLLTAFHPAPTPSSVDAPSGTVSSEAMVPEQLPVIAPNASDLKINAESAISVWMSGDGSGTKVLFQKNASETLLIASLTKLMTADIVLENYNLSDNVTISRQAAAEGGSFQAGETFPVKDLLYTMLIGQDNVAAYALSEKIGTSTFVALMNQKAKDLELSNTYYANSVGSGLTNHSTANDLTKLIAWLLKNQPSIFSISVTPTFSVYDQQGILRYTIKNMNPLLTDTSISWANQIIGSKMANNQAAGQCLVLVVRPSNNRGYVINIVLRSKDRFGEMKNVVNWVYTSYSLR